MNPASTNLDPVAPPPPPASEYTEAPGWMLGLFVAVYALFCVMLGVTLLWLPWSDAWFETGFAIRWPQLQEFLHHGFVRGAVSGLGLIDIWLGFLEIIHYYRHRRRVLSPSSSRPDESGHFGQYFS